jgi:hypothetical protein
MCRFKAAQQGGAIPVLAFFSFFTPTPSFPVEKKKYINKIHI